MNPSLFFQTEKDIEVWAECVSDRIDNKYMKDQLTTEQYNLQTRALHEQVKELYDHLKPRFVTSTPVDFFTT